MDGDVRYACGGYGAVQLFVFDVMLFLIELAFAEKIVDGFIVLHGVRAMSDIISSRIQCEGRTISRNWPSSLYSHPLSRRVSAARNTSLTARGIIPIVASVYRTRITIVNSSYPQYESTHRTALHGK